MGKLTADQARDLASAFHDMSVAVGNFRFDNWDDLKKSDRASLESVQWTLLNYSSDFTATAISLTLHDLQGTLQSIQDATAKATTAINRIKLVDKVLRIASAAAGLGAAIVSGHPEAIGDGLKSVFDEATS